VNSLRADTDDEQDHRSRGGDREITLGTTMILLIFFALAVYGAVIFGFGYSLGSKHNGSGIVTAAPLSSGAFGNFKPAPGNPLTARPGDRAPAVDTTPVPYTPPQTVKVAPTPAPIERPAANSEAESVAAAVPARLPPPAAAPAVPPASTSVPTNVPPPMAVPVGGTFVVQVAAVSHQEDADLIATTLRRRGYLVNVRTEADRLMHVQVGPFPTRKDADAMKARLLADGFNAYIK
jgi:cell division septation protein DedD